MLSVATCRRSIGLLGRSAQVGLVAIGSENEKVLPTPSVGFDPDAAAVLLDDVAGDGEARARSRRSRRGRAPGRPCRSARRSRAWAAFAGPHAMIGDGHDDIVRHRPDRDRDVAAVRAELHGVVDEVDDDLAEAIGVAADRRDRVGDLASGG